MSTEPRPQSAPSATRPLHGSPPVHSAAGPGGTTSTWPLKISERPSPALRVAAIAFLAGIVLFCARLYLLALGAPRGFGAITPAGGVALILGWLALAIAAA